MLFMTELSLAFHRMMAKRQRPWMMTFRIRTAVTVRQAAARQEIRCLVILAHIITHLAQQGRGQVPCSMKWMHRACPT